MESIIRGGPDGRVFYHRRALGRHTGQVPAWSKAGPGVGERTWWLNFGLGSVPEDSVGISSR